MRDPQETKIQSLRNAGWSTRRIAAHTGKSDKAVREILMEGKRWQDWKIAVAIFKNPTASDDVISRVLLVPLASVKEVRAQLERAGM